MWQAINRLLREHLGNAEMGERVRLPGGEIHQAWRLTYGEHQVFVKCDTHELLATFSVEAEQLRLLSRSQSLRVPQVYGVGSNRESSFLLLEYLPLVAIDDQSATLMGKQLAQLHQWGEQLQYGFDYDNELSTVIQPNCWQKRWATFFAEQRIAWQLQLAAEKGMNFGSIEQITALAYRQLQDHHPTPSLLHGDLWSGNCAAIAGQPVIFDPACYWGDRECDLAMLPTALGWATPFLAGYQSVYPLSEGYQQRQGWYQLYHLLNRCNRLGGQYFVDAQSAIDKLFTHHSAY
jgi:fructosamine-3-kinase